MSRRKFIKDSLAVGAFSTLLGSPLANATQTILSPPSTSKKPLHILILGGTSFLGPYQIAYALERGHKVSIFTRGKTKPTIQTHVFDKVEHLVGDRENNLEALKNRSWDAVIDNSGRRVKWTKDTAQLLKDKVSLYLYTSSTGVYYPYLGKDIKENTKLVTKVPSDITEYQKMEYDYGVMKTNSEQEAIKAFGKDRSIIVRPTYMMGPGDRTDRFTYWPVRLAKGGKVLIPGKPTDPVQYIDVRDVAQWMIRLIEDKNAGVYNAVGPASKTGVNQFVYGAHAAFNSKATFTNIPDYIFLKEQDIHYIVPWIMPTGNNAGSALVNNSYSIANGLTFTPLAKSVLDIHTWWYSNAVTQERRERLEKGTRSIMVREALILKAWKAK
jgi:2'-hydroxyisoflavone reductase